eukprot:CAMPEP_0180370170 /NCGR_PEP_ID=MMETSP0989-20121125/18888_1 /TAXON_ID=697907 /ORGANISM="non described non described, Strain CCMP2293" /LENGTH=62 /DNA_ID=CAMNT_0022365599 /DNA_START=95 /DNA_END=283 /DNA_ORIENTATION=+
MTSWALSPQRREVRALSCSKVDGFVPHIQHVNLRTVTSWAPPTLASESARPVTLDPTGLPRS